MQTKQSSFDQFLDEKFPAITLWRSSRTYLHCMWAELQNTVEFVQGPQDVYNNIEVYIVLFMAECCWPLEESVPI
jgi:hypothetical protein